MWSLGGAIILAHFRPSTSFGALSFQLNRFFAPFLGFLKQIRVKEGIESIFGRQR